MCVFVVTVILLHCGSFCHENKFLICVNIPGNKAHSDSHSERILMHDVEAKRVVASEKCIKIL